MTRSMQRTAALLDLIHSHPFFDMISASSAIVLNEQLYLVQGKECAGNVARIGRRSISLSEPIPLHSLDDLFMERDSTQLSSWRSDYAKELLREYVNSNLSEEDEDEDIPQRIYLEVFPHFSQERRKSRLSTLIGVGNESTKINKPSSKRVKNKKLISSQTDKVYRKVQELKDEIITSDEKIIPKRSKKESFLNNVFAEPAATYVPSSLIGRAIGVESALFDEGHMLPLVPTITPSSNPNNSVRVNGREYLRGDEVSLENVQREYSNILLRKQTEKTFEKELSKENIVSFLEGKFANIPCFDRMRKYEEGEVGFERVDDEYYVTLRVPTFAIKSPEDGKLYKFNSFRIGLSFNYKYSGESILAMDAVRHPFVDAEYRYEEVCIGTNKLPTGNSISETIALRLKKARNILMYGYKSNKVKPYLVLSTDKDGKDVINPDYFKPNCVSPSFLRKRNIPVFDPKGAKK